MSIRFVIFQWIVESYWKIIFEIFEISDLLIIFCLLQ